MKLQTYKEYTVDYRLKQFRKCEGGWESGGMITFIDFDSEQGEQILSEMVSDRVLDLTKMEL